MTDGPLRALARGARRAAPFAAVLAASLAHAPSGLAQDNPVVTENALAGTTAWNTVGPPAGTIEGYASEASVRAGDVLHLHVSTNPANRYRVEIYRLGWYGGTGGRLMTCLPSCSTDRQGAARPVPAPDSATGYVNAKWPVTDAVTVPNTWVSGYYVAKLLLTSGQYAQPRTAANVPFLVRLPVAATSRILVQAPVNTWQAYNSWGGKSLYAFNSTNGVAANRVSFDRPYGAGAQSLFSWEYQLVRFLEREGYDVSYTTDVDTHRDPASLRAHSLDVVAGHDEYWTKEMRDAYEAARGAGVDLAFVGANDAYWQMRYADGERTIVEYRSAAADPIADPALETVTFRTLTPPRPECTLVGVQYQGGGHHPGDPPRDYTLAAPVGDPWLAFTGLQPGAVLPDLVGYEWDALLPGCAVPPETILFHYQGTPTNADAVRYTAPSGARVFAAGSLQFTWGLDDWGGHPDAADPRLQQFARDVFDDLAGAAARPHPPASTAPPSIAGQALVGQTLSAGAGAWSGTLPIGLAYRWQRCEYADAVKAADPAAYWRLAETSGTVAVDASGHGRSARYVGAVALGQPGAPTDDADKAVALDGAGSYLTLPDLGIPSGPFSLELWAKLGGPGSTGPSDWAVLFAVDGDWRKRVLWRTTDGLLLAQFDGNAYSTSAATLNAWHHLVFVFDGTAERFYVDGRPVGLQSTGLPSWSGTAKLAVTDDAASYFFRGALDEAAIYRTALSAKQVGDHFAGCVDIANATASTYQVRFGDAGARLRLVVTATSSDGTTAAPSAKTAAVSSSPTASLVTDLAARRSAEGVVLRWRARTQADLLAFDAYRGGRGAAARINRRPIAAAAGRAGTFSLLDRTAPPHRTVRYWLDAVSTGGRRTWFGPLVVR